MNCSGNRRKVMTKARTLKFTHAVIVNGAPMMEKLSLSHPAPQNVLQLSLRDKGLLVYSAHRDIHHTFCRHHNRIPK